MREVFFLEIKHCLVVEYMVETQGVYRKCAHSCADPSQILNLLALHFNHPGLYTWDWLTIRLRVRVYSCLPMAVLYKGFSTSS